MDSRQQRRPSGGHTEDSDRARNFTTRNPLPPRRQTSQQAIPSSELSHQPQPSDTDSSDPEDRPLSYFRRNYPAGRPLIDQVTNQWRNNTDAYWDDHSDDEAAFISEKDGHWEPADWLAALHPSRIPRRVKRYLLVWILLLCGAWYSWQTWLRPRWTEKSSLDELYAHTGDTLGLEYGITKPVEFSNMILVQKLDSELVPSPNDGGRRLVFVGDVHGCKDDLVALLDKISFRSSHDHLILTGDIIAKGTDSAGTVDLARDLGASCVRGNHEDRMLLTHKEMQRRPEHVLPDTSSASSGSQLEDFHAPSKKQLELVKQFDDKQIEWLSQCPVILDVGPVGDIHDIVVVHAGLVPGVPYERQDPYFSMNMRTMDVTANLPFKGREGMPWDKVWNHYMNKQEKRKRDIVVYGHDSKTGLNIQEYSKGLDSACVKGEKLSAWIVTVDLEGKMQHEVVSVRCSETTTNAAKDKKEKKVKKEED